LVLSCIYFFSPCIYCAVQEHPFPYLLPFPSLFYLWFRLTLCHRSSLHGGPNGGNCWLNDPTGYIAAWAAAAYNAATGWAEALVLASAVIEGRWKVGTSSSSIVAAVGLSTAEAGSMECRWDHLQPGMSSSQLSSSSWRQWICHLSSSLSRLRCK
jgi:hypothetical protein